jgi:di/tricarboxylate transporter
MTPQIALVLTIVGVAFALFALEWVAVDAIALGVLLTLILTGLVPLERAFEGFGSDTVIMILGLLIMTAALLRTGVVEIVGRAILRRAGSDVGRLTFLVMVATAGLSAFISNAAATAFFLPVVVGIAARARVSPSRLLMPLAFSSILTSSVTVVSTSTNILVSGVMTRNGLEPMGMFEPAPVGIPITIVGIAYMLLLGRRMIPDRTPVGEGSETFGVGPYLTEIVIRPGSKWIGKTLAESGLGHDLDLTVLRITRGNLDLPPRAATRLEAGAVLLVEGGREQILKIKDTAGIDIKADIKLSETGLQAKDIQLAEAIVPSRSPLIGRTLEGLGFRERYGIQVLAIHRHQETLREKISEVRLLIGDVLLLQGHRENLAAVQADGTLQILGQVEERRPNLGRAPISVGIFVLVIGAATFKLLALPVAALLGALLMFLTRCITPEEAYREVEWKVLILIGSLLALGVALDLTGTAKFLASQLVGLFGGADPRWLLAGFFVLTILLMPMSHQAVAIVITPIAIQTALQFGLNPRTFAMMIAIAASCAYMTPLDPSCVMVYGPGRYRFADFLKVGGLLVLLIFIVAMALVPIVWPLEATHAALGATASP